MNKILKLNRKAAIAYYKSQNEVLTKSEYKETVESLVSVIKTGTKISDVYTNLKSTGAIPYNQTQTNDDSDNDSFPYTIPFTFSE